MVNTEVKQKYIICDIDGCLIKSGWIWFFINGMKFEENVAFDMFNRMANAEANSIDKPLLNFLRLKLIGGYKIIFLTARSEIIETETINLIQKKTGLIYGKEFSINSRPATDLTDSAESKRIRLEGLIDSGKEIEFAIDDEDAIIAMYEKKGIRAIKWQNGFILVSVATEFNGKINILLEVKEEASTN